MEILSSIETLDTDATQYLIPEGGESSQLILRAGGFIILASSTNSRGSHKHGINALFILSRLQNLIFFSTLQDNLSRPVGSVPAGLAALILKSDLLHRDNLASFVGFLDAGGSDPDELAHRHGVAALSLVLLGTFQEAVLIGVLACILRNALALESTENASGPVIFFKVGSLITELVLEVLQLVLASFQSVACLGYGFGFGD